MADCTKELLVDEDVVLRAVHKEDIKDGKVKSHAFLVRTNGKDNNGLSVTRECGRAVKALMEITGRDAFCSLIVAQVRQLTLSDAGEDSAKPLGLDVQPEPTELDPCHALITNTPKMPPPPIPEEILAVRKRLAEQLAKRAAFFKL